MISLFGIYYLKLYLKSKLFIIIVNLVIVFNLTYLVLWNYKFHPNQYTYFNILFKNHFDNNFEKDYWGISNIQSINHIIKNAKVYPVVVATKSFTSLPSSLLMLNEEDKEKISITYNLSEAEFIMTNYRIKHKNDFFIDKNKYKKYYEITVDNVPINTVYRKIE